MTVAADSRFFCASFAAVFLEDARAPAQERDPPFGHLPRDLCPRRFEISADKYPRRERGNGRYIPAAAGAAMRNRRKRRHGQFAMGLLRIDNDPIWRFLVCPSDAAETMIESGFSVSNAVTKGITEDCAVAATVTPMRPLDVSVGRATAEEPPGKDSKASVGQFAIERWRRENQRPVAGSSRDRNTKRRLAKMSSICPPASRDRTRRAGVFGDSPVDKTHSRANGARADRPLMALTDESKILLLDQLEFSRRPKNSSNRQARRRHVVNPARQPQR